MRKITEIKGINNMKTRSFKKYLAPRLNEKEIAEIKKQAHLEIKILRTIQNSISQALEDYMKKQEIRFNELFRRLDSPPSHVAKIQKGESNLIVSSLAHLLALFGKEPQDVFCKK